MSRIDDLMKVLTPKGVKFVMLSDVAKTVPGLSGKTKADFSDGNARFVSYKNVFANLAVDLTASDFVKIGAGERQNLIHEGDVIFTGSSETAEEVGMSSVVLMEPSQPLYLNSFCFAVRFDDPTIFVPAFSKYLFRSESIRSQIRRAASGVTRINISKHRFMKVRIPVPPIEIQQEIVRILDNYTDLQAKLQAELQAELRARQRQFHHHRDSLFIAPADEEIAMNNLGDIAEFKYGYTASAKDKGEYRFIRITDINLLGELSPTDAKFVDSAAGIEDYLVNVGDLLMARTGATFGKTMFAKSDVPAVFASFLIRIRLDEKIMLPAYYWHYAQSNLYWDQAKALASIGGQPQFNANALKQIEVPTPSLENQRRIVDRLDAFGASVNDLLSQLRAEMAIRQRQQNHYCNQLLNFGEKVA